MLILDLEWNRGYDSTQLDEVLQIGAVRVDRLGGPIQDTFNVYIRPCIHKSFSPGAKVLPELPCSLASEVDFPSALSAFLKWCGGETEFSAWGNDDFRVLKQNCEFWNLPVPLLQQTHDLQLAFGHLLGAEEQQVALWRAAGYCRVPDTFTFHNALNDAVYTAAVSEWLTEESLSYRPDGKRKKRRPSKPPEEQRELPELSQSAFPPQPRFRVGPFSTLEHGLNDRTARHPACPLCGKRFWISQWWNSSGGPYFSTFRCPEHGQFLCRLTLAPLEDSTWRGRIAVPILTPAVLESFRSALGGGLYSCTGISRRRKKRRRTVRICSSTAV